MSFPSRPEYEKLIHSLPDTHSEVVNSTLHLYSTSALTAIVQGSVVLRNGLELRIVEALDFKNGRIRHYSYTVFRGEERIGWYDPQGSSKNNSYGKTRVQKYYGDLPG